MLPNRFTPQNTYSNPLKKATINCDKIFETPRIEETPKLIVEIVEILMK